MSGSSFTSIPVLDFSQALSPSKSTFLANLREALVNVGFFYLRNAPISAQSQEQFVEKALGLFELPLEKKLEIEMVNSPHFLGYSRLGAEITALKPDYREQFDFATELPAPGPNEPLYRNVVGPNQWPDETAIPGFRQSFDKYLSEVSSLAELFPGLIAEALDLPPTTFDQVFDNPQQHKLKLIKYPPPLGASNEGSGFQGVGPHKDSGFLTFLLQGTPHHGLEVQNKNGTWIPAPPLPGTLVINIGRSLEALTGGICTATTHRVSLRPESFHGGCSGPRFSFPVFQGVSLDLSADKISLKIPVHIRDLEFELESEKSSRRTFQVENVEAKAEVRRLNDINNRYPFIVVLVDGDGAKFLDTLLQSPEDGAVEASRRLTKAVRDFLRGSPYSSEDVPIPCPNLCKFE